MRKAVVLLLLLLLGGGIGYGQDRTFTIAGDLRKLKHHWGDIDGDSLAMTIHFLSSETTDSVPFRDYRFRYTGEAVSPFVEMAYLTVEGLSEEQEPITLLSFFVEPGTIAVEVRELPEEDMYNIEVTGTPNNELWNGRFSRYVDLNYEMVAVSRDTTFTNDEKMERIDRMLAEQDSLVRTLYRDNRESPIAPTLALQHYYSSNEYRELAGEIDYLTERFADHPDLSQLETVLRRMPGLQVGDPLPAVASLTNRHAQPVDLATLGPGKYLLLYFWSSVSEPAFEKFLALKRFPKSYEGKEVMLVGISTDPDRSLWLRSLKRHKPPGLQLWDGNREAAGDFHITVHPTHFLIDPEGTVVAKGGFTSPEEIAPAQELQEDSSQ